MSTLSKMTSNQKALAAVTVVGAVAVAVALLLRTGKSSDLEDLPPPPAPTPPPTSSTPPPASTASAPKAVPPQTASEPVKPEVKKSEPNVELTKKLEEHDKKGKKLYKEQKYTEAAAAFTVAIEACGTHPKYQKQLVILLNNRSAMYEKAGLIDLALEDCGTVLELDAKHSKARNKRARIFEGQGKWKEALTEYCAVQLDFMHSNKEKLIRGIPLDPPVDQGKMEDICDKCVPEAMSEAEARREKYLQDLKKTGGHLKLPTKHTVGMLLESFTSCEGWRADAADDKTVGELSVELAADLEPADKCDLLFRRGRRSAFDTNYDEAYADFRQAMKLLDEKPDAKEEMRYYCDLLEWNGVCKHLSYDMSGATTSYELALEACEDANGAKKCELMVRCAGIKMDEGEIPAAEKWFEKALAVDPNFPDALLHRSNLYMLQRNLEKATADIEKCLQLKPDFLSAQLRQATLFMHSNDAEKALKCLDVADRLSPKSSDIQIYRGELFFTMGNVDKALECFEKAMDYDKSNPNAYVNAALAIMNKQPAMGQPPDIPRAMELLEKGLEIDPQFQGAYIHLGQLKLTMAKELSDCVEVIDLYTQGLNQCRTKDEMADLVKMQIMAESQHEAAKLLKMKTLS